MEEGKPSKKKKYPKNLYLRGKNWYYDFIYKGTRYVGKIGPVTKTIANERLQVKKAKVIEKLFTPQKEEPEDPLFEKFMEEFLEQNHNVRNPVSSKPLLKYFSGKSLSQINQWIALLSR